MTLVSIILPNYNYEEYIGEAIASAAGQTYDAIELSVVDDCSTDRSAEVVRSLQDVYRDRFRRFELVRCGDNGGVSRLLNQSVPRLRGEITCILDADDRFEPEYVAETVRALFDLSARRPRVAFVYTDCVLMDSAGTIVGRGEAGPFDAGLLQTRSYIPGCAPTFTRALLGVLPFDTRIRAGNKHHRWLKLVDSGYEGFYLNRPLFRYRMHDRNLSGIGARLLSKAGAHDSGSHELSSYWPIVPAANSAG